MAKIKVLATLPEFDWITKQIADGAVQSDALLSGHEDPHFVDVTPAFIFKVKKADVIIYNGLSLESTWLPKVLELAGNKRILGKGNCNASKYVGVLGKQAKVDRSMGDVHKEGNPHYSFSPKQMILAAKRIKECLAQNDQKNAQRYSKNYDKLKNNLLELRQKMADKLNQMKNKKFMSYHKEFVYFCDDFELLCLKTVEATPGVLPSARQLAKMSLYAKEKNISLVLATDINPIKTLKRFEEMSEVPFVQVESHLNTQVKSYTDFMNHMVERIVANAK